MRHELNEGRANVRQQYVWNEVCLRENEGAAMRASY